MRPGFDLRLERAIDEIGRTAVMERAAEAGFGWPHTCHAQDGDLWGIVHELQAELLDKPTGGIA